MSAGDDSGALERTGGLLTGLLGAQDREMTREDVDKKAARAALQKMRGTIPGAQVHALVPNWDPANNLDESASSALIAGAGRGPLQAERLKAQAAENARQRATQLAIANMRTPGHFGPRGRAALRARLQHLRPGLRAPLRASVPNAGPQRRGRLLCSATQGDLAGPEFRDSEHGRHCRWRPSPGQGSCESCSRRQETPR